MQLSPKAVRLIGRGALMIAGSTLMGFIMKGEEHLKNRIDEHYESKKEPENTDDSEN